MNPTLLQFNSVSLDFGGLRAVSSVSLQIAEGELVGIIGPNGAGKTTIFNLITGVYRPTQGEIFFDQGVLTSLSQSEIAVAGISRTFQNIRLFAELTVLENVLCGFHLRKPYSFFEGIIRGSKYYRVEHQLKDEARRLLGLLGLSAKESAIAGSLSYGDQRRLEIARALATRPKLLLLDEPAAGLNSSEKIELMHVIARLRKDFKLTLLLIEHDMKLVMGICERIFVLDHGELIAEGAPESVQKNEKVIEAYLGVA